MSRKFVAFLITVAIIIALTLVGVGITYILRVTNIDSSVRNFLERRDVVSYTTVSTIVSSPVSDLDKIPDSITIVDATTSKLSSEVLKLSFNYQSLIGNFSVLTNKKGNRISIKSAEQSDSDSQYVELYSKKTDESLEDAVNRIFLDGVPETFCYFKPEALSYKFDNKNYIFGSINAGIGVNPEQCPTPYTKNESKGKRFFFYDPQFQDRFGFIFVGNTFIPGTTSTSHWFESIKLEL